MQPKALRGGICEGFRGRASLASAGLQEHELKDEDAADNREVRSKR